MSLKKMKNLIIYMLLFSSIGLMLNFFNVNASASTINELKQKIEENKISLIKSEDKEEELEKQIQKKKMVVADLVSETETLNIEKNQYEEDMSERIAYYYENTAGSNIFEMLLGSGSFADFINRVEYASSISEYDREKLKEYSILIEKLEEKKDQLNEEAEQLGELIIEQQVLQEKLKEAISEKEAELKRVQEQAKMQSQGSIKYTFASGSGVLTRSKGVNYYGGHRETWYSQRVLPGGGLKIPGRHVEDDGTIRDVDGYICVASSDYPKGTIVETSLGTGKVYDCGCASGTIDIYTDW